MGLSLSSVAAGQTLSDDAYFGVDHRFTGAYLPVEMDPRNRSGTGCREVVSLPVNPTSGTVNIVTL